jgi:hypothetical protein
MLLVNIIACVSYLASSLSFIALQELSADLGITQYFKHTGELHVLP